MKPLTKTTVNRGGGIAARFAAPEPKPIKLDQAEERLEKVVVRKLATPNPVANQPRYARWREANPELYKERQAAYMRKWRAADKLRKAALHEQRENDERLYSMMLEARAKLKEAKE